MKRSAVLFMFLLLLVSGGVTLFMLRNQAEEVQPKSPLESIDYSSIASISAKREELPRWTLERRGSNLTLTSEAVAAGKPVAGNPELRGRVLGFLQDADWIEHRPVAGFDLGEWGLDPALIQVEIVDSSGSHAFDVGRADMNGDVWLRARGGDQVYKYAARAVNDLGLEARWYRDARLADIPAHLADEIIVEPGQGAGYKLHRIGIRWYVQIEGGRSFRADPTFADQMTVALTNLTGQPVDGLGQSLAGPPLFKVTVKGQARECSYEIMAIDERGIAARRSDEPDLRSVDRMLARYFVADPTSIEDDRLIGIDPSEITGVQISGKGRDPVHLQQSGQFWRLLFNNILVRPVDPEAFRACRERLESMKSRGNSAAAADFEADRELTIEFDQDLAIPPLKIAFSAPDDEGVRLVRRSDQAGVLTVGPEADELLELRYWDLMVRYFTSVEADTIDALSIQGPDGRRYSLKRSVADGNWELLDLTLDGKTVGGFTKRLIPGEPLAGLVDRLAQLTVRSFVGEKSDEELARIFAEPRYIIGWSSPEMLLAPATDARSPRITETKSWEIGSRIDDDHLNSRMSNFPALVFPVAGDDLLPITDALRALNL